MNPDPVNPEPSPKYRLTKADAPKILKAWAWGSAAAAATFTGVFITTSIDWGMLAGLVAQFAVPAVAVVVAFLNGKAKQS